MKVYESRIKRGQAMPSQCELCTSIRKDALASSTPSENACFLPRKRYEGLPEEQQRKMDTYAPFVNSKRTIQRTCRNFAHVKSVTESYGRRRVEGRLETPFDDLKVR